MDADDNLRLLNSTLPHLNRYRASLTRSRSGAASDREQERLALDKLIEQIARAVREKP